MFLPISNPLCQLPAFFIYFKLLPFSLHISPFFILLFPALSFSSSSSFPHVPLQSPVSRCLLLLPFLYVFLSPSFSPHVPLFRSHPIPLCLVFPPLPYSPLFPSFSLHVVLLLPYPIPLCLILFPLLRILYSLPPPSMPFRPLPCSSSVPSPTSFYSSFFPTLFSNLILSSLPYPLKK